MNSQELKSAGQILSSDIDEKFGMVELLEPPKKRGPGIKNITGLRSGKLVAVKPSGKTKGGETKWECQCDCGCTVHVRVHSILHGVTKSCGCIKHGRKSKTPRKPYASFRAKVEALLTLVEAINTRDAVEGSPLSFNSGKEYRHTLIKAIDEVKAARAKCRELGLEV